MRRGAATLATSLVLCDLLTSSFIHVSAGWVNDGPGSALLWITMQVALVAGVVSLARAHSARRSAVLDTVRLRYTVRGLVVLAGCSVVALALAAADVVDELATTGIDRAPVALIGALTLSVAVLPAAGATAAWQAARRLAAIDDAPLTATGREPSATCATP